MEHTPGGDRAPAGPPPPPQAPGPAAPVPPPGPYAPYPGYAPPYPPYPPAPPPRRRGPSRAAVWTAITVSALVSVGAALTALMLVFTQSTGSDTDPVRSESVSGEYAAALTEAPGAVEVSVYEHPAYALDMPEPVDCAVPDLHPSSEASWERFTDELGVCLNDLWRPRLEELGLRVADPEFATTDTDPEMFAGDEGTTMAYYDGREQTVTVVVPNVTELSREFPSRDQEAIWAALIGHEYGHHVQQVTGVLDRSYDMEFEAESEEASLRALRRTELQAECMGGIAMRGLGFDPGEIDRVNDVLNGGGDLPTHGTSDNRLHWYDAGTTGERLASCNTFEASASEVD
ncbi:neutral zinc metallopeptidase [Nocardiopsis halophila]|uniref:neutral zinc metallopeptidase n=1 Tax=Nocardiopsis halophila TaxID=141692 RepID=UPI00037A6550|nr:neutral zinc metallopeptidase [Nocardiopsis halophila]